ncbi:putative enoyl-coa hydratase/isomerase family protein [Rhodococcoides trifolii]|uniref:Enoyl-coa hydratase/isomerase family protein n=1 Tax=Rhodococcoides trifolii TaxID=908250 RepID=A0A917FX37_9NOCA|nr:enoyl-CoA hydratase/isomerase family protein [Rhodococcus trifolii]GGG13137.1 putative enoyl-coa hydratase/isomerase family protein [Rhodococcus trifolii]
MPSLERDGDVFVLLLGNADGSNPENRFGPVWIDEMHAVLDEVLASDGPAALVTTASGKFYTNGLDTDHAFSDLAALPAYLDRVHEIYTRILEFPMATVAAVQGHAFGAGAMLALAHDFHLMRADRGYFCLPEVSLGMPFTPGMTSLVTSRLSPQTALEAMTTGRRYGGPEAVEAGIVESTATAEEIRATAVAIANALTSNRGPNLTAIKRSVHGPTLAALAQKTTEKTFSFGQ